MTDHRPPVTVISSIGDPRDRKTWSGTPHGILTAFDQIGVETRVHGIAVARPLQYVLGGTNFLLGYGRQRPERIGAWNAYVRRACQSLVRAAGPGPVLHFGSGHLPLYEKRTDQRHFLVTDYSMHLEMTQGMFGRIASPRYRRSALAAEEKTARQLDAVFTISNFVRDDWRHRYELDEANVIAIGTGLGNPMTLDGHDKDYRRGHLLFVAKHGFDIKGGPLLLAGFKEALKTRPDLRLVIIANASDPSIQPHLAELRSHPSIDFRQSGTPDFADLVRGAALFAGPGEREPWGLIYLEALMCETPILGLNRNAFPELSDDGRVGFIADEISGVGVGRAIVEAMSDPERLARMGAAGRAFVEARFTWRRVADTMLHRMGIQATP